MQLLSTLLLIGQAIKKNKKHNASEFQFSREFYLQKKIDKTLFNDACNILICISSVNFSLFWTCIATLFMNTIMFRSFLISYSKLRVISENIHTHPTEGL